MRQTKSYMVPKLICVNMLALMMFTFEHKTPADDQPLFKTAKVKQPVASKQAVLMQVAASPTMAQPQTPEDIEKPAVLKKPAVYNKRMHQSRAMMNAQPMLIKARYSSTAVDCCFRGNRI